MLAIKKVVVFSAKIHQYDFQKAFLESQSVVVVFEGNLEELLDIVDVDVEQFTKVLQSKFYKIQKPKIDRLIDVDVEQREAFVMSKVTN